MQDILTNYLVSAELAQATAAHNMLPMADLARYDAVLAAESDTIEVPISIASQLGDFEVLDFHHAVLT